MRKILELKSQDSLKRSFITAMLAAVVILAVLSSATIWGCGRVQRVLLPDPNEAFLHVKTTDEDGTETERTVRLAFGGNGKEAPTFEEQMDSILVQFGKKTTTYSIEKIERSYDSLSPRRKALYSCLSVCKVLLPALYSVIGTLLSALWFYRRKLEPPIMALENATENIAAENLDFTVDYKSRDEMGRLCQSFETMRQALQENYRALWNMLEERRILQASLAHDLRNPIAIIEGYTEYLQQKASRGALTEETLRRTLDNLSKASKRLIGYTMSIQNIQRLEDVEVMRTECQLADLLKSMAEDFIYIGEQRGISVSADLSTEARIVQLDQQMLFRILENLFSNAVRFAAGAVVFRAWTEGDQLAAAVEDDGPGFPEAVLRVKNSYNLSISQEGSHMGIGLIVSRILCEKQGGRLLLTNRPEGGARAEVVIPL